MPISPIAPIKPIWPTRPRTREEREHDPIKPPQKKPDDNKRTAPKPA